MKTSKGRSLRHNNRHRAARATASTSATVMSRCNACWTNLEGDTAFISGCKHIFCIEHATSLLEK